MLLGLPQYTYTHLALACWTTPKPPRTLPANASPPSPKDHMRNCDGKHRVEKSRMWTCVFIANVLLSLPFGVVVAHWSYPLAKASMHSFSRARLGQLLLWYFRNIDLHVFSVSWGSCFLRQHVILAGCQSDCAKFISSQPTEFGLTILFDLISPAVMALYNTLYTLCPWFFYTLGEKVNQ